MKFNLVSILVLSIFLLSCKETDEQFAERLVAELKEKSIYRDDIDWENFEKKVKESAKISRDSSIVMALTLHNNPHTFYQTDKKLFKGVYKLHNTVDACSFFGSIKVDKFKDIAYLKITSFYPNLNDSKSNKQKASDFINEVLHSIEKQDKLNLKAWIIDLRFNYGGDMWPMLIALSPFLNDGKIGYFKSDRVNEEWRKEDNEIWLNGVSQNKRVYNAKVEYGIKNKEVKIAVLINKRTASAGEATAIALKSLKNVKFFGSKTSGLATGNQPISMRRNETLILTTSYMCDASGKKYTTGIFPDQKVCTIGEFENSVISWLYQ